MAAGPEKLKAVAELVKKLSDDLDEVSMLPEQRQEALEQLKVYGRDPRNADPIFAKDGISMLVRHAFYSPSSVTAHAALKVLANALLLKPETRQIFVDLGFIPRACAELQKESWEDEFLHSRLLFFSTYDTNLDIPELIEKHQLAERISENLHRHIKYMKKDAKDKVDPMEDMALSESVRLLFNAVHYAPDLASAFDSAVPHAISLLWRYDISPTKALDPPMGSLINALSTLDLASDKSKAALFQGSDANKAAARLIDILEAAMPNYSSAELDHVVAPLMAIILKVHEHAPESVKEYISSRLLPTAEDRENVLGTGNTISARLLKNSTNPLAPAFREVTSRLFFDMSGGDAGKFVENVGYGFASGFLFQNNLPVPASAEEAYATGNGNAPERPINPTTGQFLDAEKLVEMPEMSQEEKEREAERLFVLFERLKKTGIVDIENPVETAMREGRFRELKDDEVEELD